MNARRLLLVPLLIALLLPGCCRRDDASSRSAPQPVYVPTYTAPVMYASPPMYAAPQSAQQIPIISPSNGTRSLGTVREGSGIIFKIIPDGPAQRVEWWSPQPAGPSSQICFEADSRIVLCNDVPAGSRNGVVYAFGDTNLAGATAVFRSAP